MGIPFGLIVEFHSQCHRIYHNQNENRVLERLRCNEPPNFVLNPMFRYVASYRFCFQRKFDAIPLIFVEFAVFVLLFALILKCDDNETDENVHHKKGNDNDVNDVIGSDHRTKIVYWTAIFFL